MLPLPELESRFGQALSGNPVGELSIRGNGLTSAQRLQVYRNNMQSALMGALRNVYPTTERLVGEEFFTATAHAYVKANPSHSGNIQDYGRAFPQFIHSFEPAAALPYLADVAVVEWLRLETAQAPGHTPMDLAALAAVPRESQPGLHFRRQSAVRIFSSRFPVLTIWEYCQSVAPETQLDIDLPGECVLFARLALDVYMRRLTAGEYTLLHRLAQDKTFEAACLEALEVEPGFDVEQRFAALVREEILTGFHH